MELSAELGKVKAVHGDLRGVSCLWNAEMLTVKCDEVETELCALFLPLVLKDDVERAGFLLRA